MNKEHLFCTMHEKRAYSLAKHLRNAGLSPKLEFGRDPSEKWIFRSTVACLCPQEQWDGAVSAMYLEESKEPHHE